MIMKRPAPFLLFASLFFIVILFGCEENAPPGLDKDPTIQVGNKPQPVIDSISPSGSALAAVDKITIYGKNFSSTPADNFVYFNASTAKVLSSTSTRLVVISPIDTGTLSLKIAVAGADLFSAVISYVLRPAIIPFGNLAKSQTAYGLCAGPDTNLYVSIQNADLTVKDEGIFKLTADGSLVSPPYILPTTSPINTNWPAIKYGPDGNIYSVKGTNRVVYKLEPGKTNPGGTPWATTPTGANTVDLDYDPAHYLWVVAKGTSTTVDTSYIARIKSDATVKTFGFSGGIRAVRYYDGYLYVAASKRGANQIWRAPVVADTLGTPEVYFDVSTIYTTSKPIIWGITFAADGDMYVGLDGPDYLIVIHPDKSVEKLYSSYVANRTLNSPCKSFAWIGTTLYVSTDAGRIVKINTNKPGAPYYGIQ
jgi:hypothetical protein